MSSGSWQAFADVLGEEDLALGALGAAALALTGALVGGTAAAIEAADRTLDARRVLHSQVQLRRSVMMKSGFGDRSLSAVCGYAPGPMRRALLAALRDMTVHGIALQITVGNNKALILAGLLRVSNTLAVLKRSMADQDGTYKRRGTLNPPSGSVIVSRKA